MSRMPDDSLPDLSPAALSRLVAGMTSDEVEAIVGRFHRPNLHEGREYFAWIGEGGMLRAFFDGPGRSLSRAALDTAEEQRSLDLGPNSRRRARQATIMQTWYCVPCRQRYRQPQTGRAVTCAECGVACERVIPSIRVPSPKHAKAWDRFWVQYRVEKELLDAYGRGKLRKAVRLELFDIDLPKRRRINRST
jgi:DNA-directed RNA polymerase subunit RPC12/RpoP